MSAFLWILSGTVLVGATILLWGRYEYLKQKRISVELDKERAELEQKLIEEEKERVRLEQQRQATNATIQGQDIKKAILIEKAEPVEIVYPMSRAQAAPTMKPTVNPRPKPNPTPTSKPKRTSTSSSSKNYTSTSRSTSRRDDDDYNNSTVLGSTWGSYSSNNDSSSWGSSSSSSSCDSSSSSWGSDSSSSGSWCD